MGRNKPTLPLLLTLLAYLVRHGARSKVEMRFMQKQATPKGIVRVCAPAGACEEGPQGCACVCFPQVSTLGSSDSTASYKRGCATRHRIPRARIHGWGATARSTEHPIHCTLPCSVPKLLPPGRCQAGTCEGCGFCSWQRTGREARRQEPMRCP